MSTPSIFCLKKLRNLEKSREGYANDWSSISRLPDEIILQILNRLIDLKTLCFCYLVSRRFSSIVLEVDAISFASPLSNPRISNKNTVSDVAPSSSFARIISSLYGESFLSAYRFLIKFKGVKSLCIELLSSGLRAVDNRLLKWKVKFGNRIESIIFLFPNSISDNDGLYLNGNGDEDENKRRRIPYQCLKDVTARHMMMLYLVKDLPLLEEVSVTDSRGRGRLSLSGKKLSGVKEWVHSTSETVFNRVEVPDIVNNCYIPVLKLPVSGYVMKGIYFGVIEMNGFQGGNDFLMNSENGGFEDKEEAAYTEAMMEILEKHKGIMHRFM
ncbi:F-box protein AUF1 [Lactuca sativa]|uniref:F-box protein AUF1 n=1 Tax=Lactuca sativa TaxID=4236 RepID=UPI000CC704B9|nr:F-box protein AUF1 [Lactuca sativa]XP_023763336.1 F-box protein AUF1 [Lactuca sativa]